MPESNLITEEQVRTIADFIYGVARSYRIGAIPPNELVASVVEALEKMGFVSERPAPIETSRSL